MIFFLETYSLLDRKMEKKVCISCDLLLKYVKKSSDRSSWKSSVHTLFIDTKKYEFTNIETPLLLCPECETYHIVYARVIRKIGHVIYIPCFDDLRKAIEDGLKKTELYDKNQIDIFVKSIMCQQESKITGNPIDTWLTKLKRLEEKGKDQHLAEWKKIVDVNFLYVKRLLGETQDQVKELEAQLIILKILCN